MTKKDFLDKLREKLEILKSDEVEDIINEYSEHIDEKVKSGVVELLLEEISYEALPENLIEKVEIDLDGKTAGDTIRVKDLPIATAEGIHLKTNPEETVVQVTEVHNAPEEEETEEAAEE